MKKVYVVLAGDDCEGAYIQAVFSNKKDAVAYLDEEYSEWLKIHPDYRRETYIYDGKVHKGCASAFIEEWDVK